MANIRKIVRSVCFPEISTPYFLYRLPFYLNMICTALIFYWEYRFDLFRYSLSYDPLPFEIVVWTGRFSWIIAYILGLRTLARGRKKDYIGLAYLLAIFLLRSYVGFANLLCFFDPH